MTDIIKRIDELATKCPHCGREWHELALTRRVAGMFNDGRIYSSYFAYEDTTPIVCHGSTFIGPMRQEHPNAFTGRDDSSSVLISSYSSFNIQPPWITLGEMLHATNPIVAQLTASFESLSLNFKTWLLGEPEPPKCFQSPDEIEIEFGPQNWLPATEPVFPDAFVKAIVSQRFHEFSAIETHAPENRPYDFEQLYKWQPIPYPTEKRRK